MLPHHTPPSTPDLATVATGIRAFGSVSGASSALITDLADAVERGDTSVVGTDLLRRFPPDVLLPEPEDGRSGFAAVVEPIRDLLIFAPLALTWYRFSVAVSAYRDSTGQSLLDFWRTGGRGVQPLATSAVWIAGLVLIVILLTVLLHVDQSRQDRAAAQYRRRRSELSNLLVTAGLNLPRNASTRPEVSWTDLRQLAEQLGRAGAEFAAATTGLSAHVDGMVSSHRQQIETALGTWTAAAERLAGVGDRISAPDAVLRDLSRLQRTIVENDAELRAELLRLTAQLQQASTVAMAEDDTRRQIAERLVQANERIGATLPYLTQWADAIAEALARIRGQQNPGNGHFAAAGHPQPVKAASDTEDTQPVPDVRGRRTGPATPDSVPW